jgi:pimeloyl-ACP methyl ester carboxylesterase
VKRLVLLIAILAGLVLYGLTSFGSTDKSSMVEQLLNLPGNDRAAPSLEQLSLELDLPGLPGLDQPVEVTVLRLPRPDAPRLLLLHGTPGTLLNWTPVVFGDTSFEGLNSSFDITAIELPGHGMSDDGLEPKTFQECADFIAAVADALELMPSIVVGHSYGGEVSWRLALDRPDLLEALVLVDSSGYPRQDDEWLPEEQAMRDLPGAGWGWLLNSPERIASALEPHFRDTPPEPFSTETFLVCDDAVNWRTMVNLARDENGTRSPELRELAMPTLLVWGVDDVAYPVENFARRFAADIPHAELVLMERCGHYPPLERPAEFVRVLRDRFASEN